MVLAERPVAGAYVRQLVSRARVSVTRATLSSDNTVFAQLTLDTGPKNVWDMAHRLGVQMSPDHPFASIGLGSLAVDPLDMAAAYATFPTLGIYAKPTAIEKVVLPGGQGRLELGQARRRSACSRRASPGR